MKSFWKSAVVGVALVGVSFSGNIRAADPVVAEPAKVTVKKVAEAPKIDGRLDEAVWQQATVTESRFVWGKVGQKLETPKLLSRFAWDDQYLYIAYETFDENILALGTGEEEGPKGNQREGAKIHDPEVKVDVVEFFVSSGPDDFFWELHHNATNQFNDIWCAVVDEKANPLSKLSIARFGIHFGTREFLADEPDAGVSFARAVHLKPKADGKPSTPNDPSDKDTGYTAELRIPWVALGAPTARESWISLEPKTPGGPKPRKRGPWKMAGAELKIFAVNQDGDLNDRYQHPSPTFPGGWFHRGAAHWLRYVLAE